jgi:LuxR family transcriptional regulator, maltose regulon positive regulatory protein
MRGPANTASIKTSAPSLEGIIERPRLVNALARLPAKAKWLQSPSGTGKSTLAASYARSRAVPLAWYRLDDRDNDPGFFYAEFADAAGAQLRLTTALPRFSADARDRQQAFATRFFGALAAQIEEPALLVLDDLHRLTVTSILTSLAELTMIAGERVELLFISEDTVPTDFFDAVAARRLSLLNDVDLHFDASECRAMTAALRIAENECERLAAVTGGHAAALVLACELLRDKNLAGDLGADTVGRIHTHLLSRLVERMPPPRQQLLLQTAFVTHITRPIAAKLAGPEAADQIDALVKLGILRRVGADANEAFEAHGLVRHGLRSLVQRQLGQQETHALAERTATVLLEDKQSEAAFTLLVDTGSASRALEVLQQLAEHYAAVGHSDLLLASIAKLPESQVQGNAWLCFWTGQAMLRVDEEQARIWFARSYSAFEAVGDTYGMRVAAASNVTAYLLEWGDLRELDIWVARHRKSGGDTLVLTGDHFETTLLMGIVCAAFVCARYPADIDSDALVGRLRVLVDSPSKWLSDDQRVQGARLLIEHCCSFSRIEQGKNIIVGTRSLIDDGIGGVLHRGRWLIIAAQLFALDADEGNAIDCLNDARALIKQFGASRLTFELGVISANYYMKTQDLSRASSELSELHQMAIKAAPAQRAEYARLMTRLLLLQGRYAEGLRWAEEAMTTAASAGFSGASLRAFEMELVYALAANERLADALELVNRMDVEPREARSAVECCLRYLFEGETNLGLLREGLKNAAQLNFINLLDRARGPLARICAAALANEIEPEFVHRLIRIKKLSPPPFTGPHWPWPVKVRTLGGFRLEVMDKAYRPAHKAQDKPLELLKLMVTCQAMGRPSVDKVWLIERLWPDSSVENARKSLDMALSRLRRLLGDDATMIASEGRLQLSPVLVWTDIQPLRHALTETQRRRDEKVTGRDVQATAATAIVMSVLDLYEGPYLQGEDGPPWLLAGREAIATLVRRALLTADLVLDGSVDDMLIAALERALAADPASEDLARALMRALLRRERHSEVVQVYRRLRQMLSLLLGIAPSRETDDIRDRAYASQSGMTSTGQHQ